MKILYFAPIYFDDMKQRPQQLAQCLAKKHQVCYIEPTVSWIRWFFKRGKTYRHVEKRISRTLTVIRLSGRFTFHKSAEILDLFGCNNWSEYWQIKKRIEQCDLIWVGYPGWYTLLRHFKGKPVVYDKMDEEDLLAKSWLLKLTLRRGKKKLVQMSDLIFASCTKFYEELKGHKPVCLVPNALPENFIQQPLANMQDTGTDGKKYAGKKHADMLVFGYVGTIGRWFDFEIVKYILNFNKNYRIILVGRNAMPVFKHKRVIYLGMVPHERLPALIRSFDVCLFNFKQDHILDTVNPVKLYEYLAMQKPVLAVRSKETEKLEKYMMIYQNMNEIARFLETGIRQPFSSEKEYIDFISNNTWLNRTEIIERELDRLRPERNRQK